MARILVIDDEPDVRRSIRRALESEGHEVIEAENGKVALRTYAGRPTDLVISDIYMPEMDGIELLMRLREAFPEARFIAISGGGSLEAEDVLEASNLLGAVATLRKPFTVEDLLRTVGGALEEEP